MSKVMNLRFPQNAENFLTSCGTGFPRITVLNDVAELVTQLVHLPMSVAYKFVIKDMG